MALELKVEKRKYVPSKEKLFQSCQRKEENTEAITSSWFEVPNILGNLEMWIFVVAKLQERDPQFYVVSYC